MDIIEKAGRGLCHVFWDFGYRCSSFWLKDRGLYYTSRYRYGNSHSPIDVEEWKVKLECHIPWGICSMVLNADTERIGNSVYLVFGRGMGEWNKNIYNEFQYICWEAFMLEQKDIAIYQFCITGEHLPQFIFVNKHSMEKDLRELRKAMYMEDDDGDIPARQNYCITRYL